MEKRDKEEGISCERQGIKERKKTGKEANNNKRWIKRKEEMKERKEARYESLKNEKKESKMKLEKR